MQNILNFSTIRRALFVGLGVFIIFRSLLSTHDWLALAGGVFLVGYGWFVRG